MSLHGRKRVQDGNNRGNKYSKLTRNLATENDQAAQSEKSQPELPATTSALEMLLNAPSERKIVSTRSASCPPKMVHECLEDLATQMESLSMVLPQSDPIEAPPAPRVSMTSAKRVNEQQNLSNITPENAQTLLDPKACLFVANLPINISDQEMQVALTQFLGDTNVVFVKVNRTRSGLPFAHVQYLDAETAHQTLVSKNHQLLWNRQLRIEPASATRYLYVGRKDKMPGAPAEQEIRELFAGFDIDAVREPTDAEKREVRFDACVVVHFTKWGECGEAMRALRDHNLYWIKGPKKSQLANPRSAGIGRPVPSLQAPMLALSSPFMNWAVDYSQMMPYFVPFFPSQPHTSTDGRPSKRRKQFHRPMDALPERRFATQW